MKFIVIGNGSMGKRRISHVLQLKAGNVIGYDIREDRRKEVEKNYKIETVKSVSELIEQKPDAIFICTPPAEHKYYLYLAVEKGWHFMCENPVWHKLDGLDQIDLLAKNKKLIANISCNMRFQRSVIKLKEIIDQGLIGDVLTGMVEIGEWLPDWHPWEPYTDYYPSKTNMGGGIDIICDLDWIIDFFGEIEDFICMADKKSSLDIDTNDIIMMIIRFKDGPIINIHSDMIQRFYSHGAKFIGEKGTVQWNCASRTVSLYTAENQNWMDFKEPKTIGKEWAEEMYLKDTEHFLKCLENKARPLNTIKNNINALGYILKALSEAR